MAWIELHQSAAWHRKTIKLAAELNVRRPEALGLLSGLWLWSVEAAPDGSLSHITDKEIAASAGWHGNPGRFVSALTTAGYLDVDRSIHDWYDFAGRLIESRIADRDRKRDDREQRRLAREEADAKKGRVPRTVHGRSTGQSGG